MTDSQFCRTDAVLGAGASKKLSEKKVAVFGLGGVGSYLTEALARAGVGRLLLVDDDEISLSNINRQLYALHSTLGRPKTEVAVERIADINPLCKAVGIKKRVLPGGADEFPLSDCDYIADAVDCVGAKLEIVKKALALNIPVISCMGAGNKTDPTLFRVSDAFETRECPLCRATRSELRKIGVKSLNVVWSPEKPSGAKPTGGTVGSSPFVPGAAGLAAAGKIILDLLKED